MLQSEFNILDRRNRKLETDRLSLIAKNTALHHAAENAKSVVELDRSLKETPLTKQSYGAAFDKLEAMKADRDALMLTLEDISDRLISGKADSVANEAVLPGSAFLTEQQSKLNECLVRATSIEGEISLTKTILHISVDQTEELRHNNDTLTTKCNRLRDYIRKLTEKCDEWEAFHRREAKVLRRLKASNDRTRQRAAELARKYQQSDLVSEC